MAEPVTATDPELTGNPLADALAQALVGAHQKVTEHAHAAGDARVSQWAEAFESEHRGVAGKALQAIMEHPDTPPMVREVLATVVEPIHQTQVILGLFSVGSIVMQFVGAAIAPHVQSVSNVAWKADPSSPLSPAELALAHVRGVISEGDAVAEAAMSGLNADRYGVMYCITGEPPGPQELMEALRRGYIDQATFEHGILQSRIRNEWIPTLLKLRYSPPPAGTVVAAAVQNHLSTAEATSKIAEAGIDPANFGWLYETAGRPPGVFELGELVHRGEFTVAQLDQAIRESDVKDKYVPAIQALIRKIPPMRSVVAAIHQGVITAEVGARKLMELGYNAEDAAIFVKEASNLKAAHHKLLAEGQVLELYTDRMITAAQAQTMLGDLGMEPPTVAWVLALADHRRTQRLQASALSKYRTLYVGHRMSETEVTVALDKLGVSTPARQDYLTVWGHERDANVVKLSKSELQGAIRRGLIKQAEFKAKAMELGYSEHAVPIIYAEAWPPTKTPPEWKP